MVVVTMVFDIGNFYVKRRECKVGKGRSRGLLLKDWIRRGKKREWRGGRKGRRMGGEQPAITIKSRSHAPGQ